MRHFLDRQIGRIIVLEHLAEITAIDPAAAGRAPDEMIDLAFGRIAHSSPDDGATGNV
jgi:hypothetical protein